MDRIARFYEDGVSSGPIILSAHIEVVVVYDGELDMRTVGRL